MVDLDSNPTKLIEIVEIGKQTADDPRGADDVQHRPTTWRSISPSSRRRLPAPIRSSTSSTSCAWPRPPSAILSAVIFNALIIVALIPLALRGVDYRPGGADDAASAAIC